MFKVIPKNKSWVKIGIFNLLYSLCLVSLAYFSKLVLDYAQIGEKTKVIYYAVILIGVIFLAVLFKVIENILYVNNSLKREIELKRLLFEKRLMVNFIDSNFHSGILLQNYITDISNIVSGEVDTLPQVCFELGRLIAAVSLIIFIDWKFLIILFIIGILGALLGKFYSSHMKRLHQDVLHVDAQMNSFFQESIENVKTIQAYQAQKSFNDFYTKKESKAVAAKKKKYVFMVTVGNALVLGSNLITAVAIFYGGYSIAVGVMTYGTLIAIIQLMGHIQNPIMSFSGLINKYSLYKTSINRLEEKLISDEIVYQNNDNFECIKLEGISYGYNDNIIVNNLNFEINKGDIIQIKGESGIGKTSLFMLLLGFLKAKSGIVTIDGKELGFNDLFSYVSQENILFSGSIKENFKLLASDDNIEEALKFANIYDEIVNLPEGLNTILNERGSGLSIGQLQRIMIAISYAKNRPIFLLDEFTSALDQENANIIINNLINSNKTIIYISHKDEVFKPNKIIYLK